MPTKSAENAENAGNPQHKRRHAPRLAALVALVAHPLIAACEEEQGPARDVDAPLDAASAMDDAGLPSDSEAASQDMIDTAQSTDASLEPPHDQASGLDAASPCEREHVKGVAQEPLALRVPVTTLCYDDRCDALVDYAALECTPFSDPSHTATHRRTMGCGLVAVETLPPLPHHKYVFDASTAELVGAFVESDVVLDLPGNACNAVSYVAGVVELPCPVSVDQGCSFADN